MSEYVLTHNNNKKYKKNTQFLSKIKKKNKQVHKSFVYQV